MCGRLFLHPFILSINSKMLGVKYQCYAIHQKLLLLCVITSKSGNEFLVVFNATFMPFQGKINEKENPWQWFVVFRISYRQVLENDIYNITRLIIAWLSMLLAKSMVHVAFLVPNGAFFNTVAKPLDNLSTATQRSLIYLLFPNFPHGLQWPCLAHINLSSNPGICLVVQGCSR